MKWLDNLILKRAGYLINNQPAGQESDRPLPYIPKALKNMNSIGSVKTSRQQADLNRENKSLNFTLHPAEGGYILELSHYDPNHDRYSQRLHIINDTDDMGDSIGKIVTLELLRR
jgi:hypothetical protein